MTTFQKGGNNKWYYRFQLNGKEYYRACKGATNKKEADTYEAIIKAELMKGNLGIIENRVQPRLKEGLKIYLKHSETNKRSYKSDISMTNHIEDFFKHIKLPNIELTAITTIMIDDFKQYLKDELDLKNSSINRHLEALSKMFNLCIDNELIEANPMRKVKKMRKENHIIRFLQKWEEKILFKNLPKFYFSQIKTGSKVKLIAKFALKTGGRKQEVLGLKWGAVDLKQRTVTFLETKSGKKRTVPLAKSLCKILSKLKKYNESEYVFTNPQTGTCYKDIKKAFNTAVKASKIKKFRFHDLRHTFATRLIEKGVDIVVAKELLGHADIKTTMVYVHSDAARKQAAIDIIDNY